jgi:ABC-type uncharacterized transport system substrate-binding protein
MLPASAKDGDRVSIFSPRPKPPVGRSLLRHLGASTLALVAILGAATDADAHPHVWIDTVATLVFDRGKVVSIKLEWTFDEFFSATLIDSIHPKRKGRFDAKETKEVYEKDFANLKEDGYFVHLQVAGKKLPVREVSDFSVSYLKGRAIYRFTVRLPSPVDPVTTPIALSVYDESYFVEVAFDEQDPLRFEGKPDAMCRYDLRVDRNTPIYFGMVFPQRLRLECRRR